MTAEFSQGQWDKLPDLLDRGDIDIVLNGFEWNSGRAERYGTSIPYYIYELQLLARKDDDSIKSWEDLATQPAGRPRKMSLLGGAAAEDFTAAFAAENKTSIELALFDGVTDAMRAAELGTDGIDGNVQDLPIWNFYRKDFPGLKAVGPPVGRGFYVALLRKTDRQLLDSVNEAINAGLRDGRLRMILERYGMWNDVQAMRALETSADGGFLGLVKAQDADNSTTGEDDADATAANRPVLSSSQSLHGLKVITQRGWFLVPRGIDDRVVVHHRDAIGCADRSDDGLNEAVRQMVRFHSRDVLRGGGSRNSIGSAVVCDLLSSP